ncbi:RNase H domain-containing protein [Trichonephila clavipes]|nr:RNase H domain-containing protein [Trichonephila clavipes]
MNTIHPHIHPDTKIACYADDIALRHTHRDIAVSEKALNKTLKGIAAWAKDLKLTINADKTNYCIFSTDRRPVLEYAALIWAPASVSSKQKLDSIQHRASKIIIGAVSSTNNEKAERECGLPPLECRRNLATVKFTNKLRCYKEDHISPRVFKEWTYTKRLKRSSTLQLNEDIRIQINLEHSILNFMQEPPFPRMPPKETKITLNLLRPCSKKEDARILKQKGLETIEKISQENFAVAYTDGSSDISLNKGGAGILFQLPNKDRKRHKINTGLIASNFTRELLAIKEALNLYSTHLELSSTTEGLAIFSDSRAALEAIIKGDMNITSAINVLLESLHCKGKFCLLQWIPAHVNIEGNECADSLAKEGRNDDQLCPTITLADANAVANYRLLPHPYKKKPHCQF